MIDPDGFRPNVGIILTNDAGQVLWARRINQDAWQFPQGGINPDETPEDALYRELNEEVQAEMADALGADSLRYLPIDSIARAINLPASNLCQASTCTISNSHLS